jgi:dihydroxyacetone kinase
VTPPEAASILAAPLAEAPPPRRNQAGGGLFSRLVAGAAESLRDAEDHLTELDRLAGDGDLGVSMRRGAGALLQRGPSLSDEAPAAGLRSVAADLRAVLGGSSGPLYAAGLLRAAAGLGDAPTPRAWASAMGQACAGLAAIGGASPGDRTMLDALHPAALAFRTAVEAGQSWVVALEAAATAAEEGAMATAALSPRFGRSSYLGERVLGVPDPGAVAVAIWLRALHRAGVH